MPIRLRAAQPFPLILLLAVPLIGTTEVIPKDGPCPSGYHTEGRYCVGNRGNAPDAFPKDGPCPSGHHTEGRYCVGNRGNAPDAFPKDGPCPSGYHTEGHYCVSHRR